MEEEQRLPHLSGENLGQMDDVEYFRRNFQNMHVPVRLEADSGFSLGRRVNYKGRILFSKFVAKLQIRFSSLFQDVMEKQLIVKK